MIDEFLTRRVTVQRAPLATAAADGSAQRVFADLATSVPFAIWAKSGSFRQTEYGLGRNAEMGGATHYAVNVGDRVVDGDETYEVMFVSRPQGAFYACDLAHVALT